MERRLTSTLKGIPQSLVPLGFLSINMYDLHTVGFTLSSIQSPLVLSSPMHFLVLCDHPSAFRSTISFLVYTQSKSVQISLCVFCFVWKQV